MKIKKEITQSHTEEDYLKAIYKLTRNNSNQASTKSISELLLLKSPTVTDMLKKLSDKNLIEYIPYQGVKLTKNGSAIALRIIRNHRLWETFLVENLKFKWDEVHDLAEQLEHIKSEELANRLDEYLDYPKFDPHGDPIPDKNGTINFRYSNLLSEVEENKVVILVGVTDHTRPFLNYLDGLNLVLGTTIQVLQKVEYDNSMIVKTSGNEKVQISSKVCKNLLVKN